jgi:hypothetical protein
MLRLEELIGESIFIRSIPVDENNPVLVKLYSVDSGGIWIQSQKLTEQMLETLKAHVAPRSPVYFLPYSQIAWICHWIDDPSLSEKSLGLSDPSSPAKSS